MILTTWQKYALVALAILIAYTAGRYTAPAKVQTKTVEKINENVQTNVTTDTKQTKMPNGVVITETITKRQTEKQIKEDVTNSTAITSRPKWRIGAIYNPAIPGFQETHYGAQVERQLFDEVYIGLQADTNKSIGIVVTFGF